MTNWDAYVKESYNLVRRAECELTINLAQDIEAYIVHLFAYYMDKPKVNTVPVAIKLMSSTSLPVTARKEVLKSIGDECLIINAMEWGKPKWPTNNYYAEMGQLAYVNRAYAERPPEDLYDDLAVEFQTASRVLRQMLV